MNSQGSHDPERNPGEENGHMREEGSMVGSFEDTRGWFGLVREEPPQEAQENGGRTEQHKKHGRDADGRTGDAGYRHGQEARERHLGQFQRRRLRIISLLFI